jgi:NAD(P)-dependent dehydrogenase (short-subunit alcohol dehydrogenase family)
MDLQLHPKVVLITGGTSGIGLSSAEFFLREGARVMISGRNVQRGHEAWQHFLNTLPDAYGHINFVSGDVAVIRDCQHLVGHTLDQFGGLDIVVNSAGLFFDHQIDDIDEAKFDLMMNTNVKGTYFSGFGIP